MSHCLKKNGFKIESIFIEKKIVEQNSRVRQFWRLLWNAWRNIYFYYPELTSKIYFFSDLNNRRSEIVLKNIKPDLVVLASAPIIKKSILKIPKLGIINAHPSLLPKYRGRKAIERAIGDGEKIGVSVHWVDAGIDTGKVILQKELKVSQTDNIRSIKQKANKLSYDLVVKAIEKISKEGK